MILCLWAEKVSRSFFVKLVLWCLRYLPSTDMCNTCSTSELLILYVDYVIGISALCSFSMLFIEHLFHSVENVDGLTAVLRDVKIESVIRFMEPQFSIETLQCVPPAWRIGDTISFSLKSILFFIFVTSLLCRWLHNGTDCPQKLWNLPHRRYSWTIWMQSCAMCSRKTLLEQGGWTKGLF